MKLLKNQLKNSLTGNGTIGNGFKLKIELINVTNKKIIKERKASQEII